MSDRGQFDDDEADDGLPQAGDGFDPVQQVLTHMEDGEYREALGLVDELIVRVRAASVAEPENLDIHHWLPRLNALRAFVLIDAGDAPAALMSAELACKLDEDDPYVLLALGNAALAAVEPARALEAANRLLAAFPADRQGLMLSVRAYARLGNWDEVLSRCEYVLGADPDDAEAAFFRVVAIESKTKGKTRLDAAEWKALAERFPHIPVVRTGRGWSLLQSGGRKQAEREFRDALTLDPGNEWARDGLIVALKARYPGYGLLLRFFDWLGSFEPRTQTMIMIGGIVGARVLRSAAEQNPALAPFIWPVLIAYFAFVLLTWLADPMLNLVLLGTAEGRRLLPADKKEGALVVSGTLATALLFLVVGSLTDVAAIQLAALPIGVSTLTLAGAYACAPGRFRRRLQWAAGVFIVSGTVSTIAPSPFDGLLLMSGILGAALSTWFARSYIRRSHE